MPPDTSIIEARDNRTIRSPARPLSEALSTRGSGASSDVVRADALIQAEAGGAQPSMNSVEWLVTKAASAARRARSRVGLAKSGGYAVGTVRSAGRVGSRVLPAWSRSTKTPAGAQRVAAMIKKQPHAPGASNSVWPVAGATGRKPLEAVIKAASLDPMLHGLIFGLAKHAFTKPTLTATKRPGSSWFKPAKLAKGIAGLGRDVVTFGAGDMVGNKLVPRWQPKVAGLRKEAIGLVAAMTLAPVAWEGVAAAGRLSRLPGRAVAKGLGPRPSAVHGPRPTRIRTVNTPEVQKVAFVSILARAALKAAPYVARVAPTAGKTLSRVTPAKIRAGSRRLAVSSAKDASLAAGSIAGANALTHVGRPRPM